MKRSWIPGILVCGLLLWDASPPPRAQTRGTAKEGNWERFNFKLTTGKEESVMVLRIWNTAASDPKWPQIALLRITPTAYNELRKDFKALKALIDGTQTQQPIFNTPVAINESCKLPEPEDEKSAGDSDWLLVITHRVSLVSCAAVREYAVAH